MSVKDPAVFVPARLAPIRPTFAADEALGPVEGEVVDLGGEKRLSPAELMQAFSDPYQRTNTRADVPNLRESGTPERSGPRQSAMLPACDDERAEAVPPLHRAVSAELQASSLLLQAVRVGGPRSIARRRKASSSRRVVIGLSTDRTIQPQ